MEKDLLIKALMAYENTLDPYDDVQAVEIIVVEDAISELRCVTDVWDMFLG